MSVARRLVGKRWEIGKGAEQFPELLRLIPEAPARLHGIGDIAALKQLSLAVVGARKATPYGLGCAKYFARRAALGNLAVVSGGAIGCDQAAHQGALDGEGITVVVLGCGADVVYPARAFALYQEIIDRGGAVVSEAPWGSPPVGWGFKRRNRIIAGLARATLIVEAGVPSGTFSTADATLAQGKDVLAVPGSIFSRESKGSNRLIAQGAVPIVDDESFEDALNAVFGTLRCSMETDKSCDEDIGRGQRGTAGETLAALTASPMRAEELIGLCGKDVIQVIRFLSELEMSGAIERLRDGRYTTKPR
ncbi:MAG: DNA-processing protein DprA [Coriobacteriales bacterium]|jgi:DNA processing protein|nr:DNA-processing protein DprA [Coriobacteriales bacterium]